MFDNPLDSRYATERITRVVIPGGSVVVAAEYDTRRVYLEVSASGSLSMSVGWTPEASPSSGDLAILMDEFGHITWKIEDIGDAIFGPLFAFDNAAFGDLHVTEIRYVGQRSEALSPLPQADQPLLTPIDLARRERALRLRGKLDSLRRLRRNNGA